MSRHLVVWLAFAVSTLVAADPYREKWISVADRLVTVAPETFAYNWGEGVQQIGLMKVHERTREAKYLDWMKRVSQHRY